MTTRHQPIIPAHHLSLTSHRSTYLSCAALQRDKSNIYLYPVSRGIRGIRWIRSTLQLRGIFTLLHTYVAVQRFSRFYLNDVCFLGRITVFVSLFWSGFNWESYCGFMVYFWYYDELISCPDEGNMLATNYMGHKNY